MGLGAAGNWMGRGTPGMSLGGSIPWNVLRRSQFPWNVLRSSQFRGMSFHGMSSSALNSMECPQELSIPWNVIPWNVLGGLDSMQCPQDLSIPLECPQELSIPMEYYSLECP